MIKSEKAAIPSAIVATADIVNWVFTECPLRYGTKLLRYETGNGRMERTTYDGRYGTLLLVH